MRPSAPHAQQADRRRALRAPKRELSSGYSPLGFDRPRSKANMSNASPLVGIALTVGIPLLIRHSSAFSLALLKPRIHHRASIKSSPSELLIILLALAAVLYNLYKLVPWSPSFRLAQDVFRHLDLPIGVNAATLRSRLAASGLADLGLTRLHSVSPVYDAAAAEGDVMERLLRKLSSMSGRVSMVW